MPTVLREGPFRFYFYSHEPNEPPHVHVDAPGATAKFWLSPAALARNNGFGPTELNRIERLVDRYNARMLEAWNDHFGG